MLVIPVFVFLIIDFSLGILILQRESIRISHPYFHHSLKPNYEYYAKWGDLEYNLVTNSLGFKDGTKRNIGQKSNLKERIVIIGDSFTEGLGFEHQRTFSGIIQDHLKDSVEVLNAGLTSYSPKLYYLKVSYLLNKGFHFEKLLVMLDMSDIQDEVLYQSFYPENNYGFIKKSDIFLQNYSFSYNKVFRRLLKRIYMKDNTSNPENILETRIDDRAAWTYNENIFKLWGEKGLGLAKENIMKLKDICDKNSIKLYIAVYPWPETLKNDSVNSKHVKIWEDFCASNYIDFINLFPYFFSAGVQEDVIVKYYIQGDDHWNAEGHEFVAEKIIDRLK